MAPAFSVSLVHSPTSRVQRRSIKWLPFWNNTESKSPTWSKILTVRRSSPRTTCIKRPIRSTEKHFYEIMEDLLLPGSQVKGYENLQNSSIRPRPGSLASCLMEHYSNFDLPALFYLIEKDHPGEDKITEALVAIAGLKLNEEIPWSWPLPRPFPELSSTLAVPWLP
jgi:hypothetical protein